MNTKSRPADGQPGPTAQLSAFVSGLRFDDLPAPVVHQAKRVLLDTLGCALGGYTTELGSVAVGFVRLAGGRPESTVVGTGEKTSAAQAAGANARMAGALDADEIFTAVGQSSHHAISTIGAALALCERAGASGRELLAALVGGYELGARLGLATVPANPTAAATSSTGWRVGGGGAGVMAAAAASARALGLGPGRTAHALGIAGVHVDVPPLKWFEATVAPMVKSLDGGWNATTGVNAALLASLGMTGFDTIFDGDTGLVRALGAGDCDFDALVGGLGERWHILDSAFKVWPCQHWMCQALTALTRILDEHHLKPEEIDRITLRTNARSSSPKFRNKRPEGAITCAFNFPHAAAMLAYRIPPGPRWFDHWALTSPEVAAFREKVEVEIEPESRRANEWIVGGLIQKLPASAEVAARGTVFTARTDYGLGDPWSDTTRLSDAALAAKFRNLASPVAEASEIWRERVERIVETVMSVESLPDVRHLAELLTPIATPGR